MARVGRAGLMLAALLPAACSSDAGPASIAWTSPDGLVPYSLDGIGAQALNCLASDMAYFDELRDFTSDDDHVSLAKAGEKRGAEWIEAIRALPDSGAQNYAPESLRSGAETLKPHWQATARTMAQMSVIDFAQGEMPEEFRAAAQHFGDCAQLLLRLRGEE